MGVFNVKQKKIAIDLNQWQWQWQCKLCKLSFRGERFSCVFCLRVGDTWGKRRDGPGTGHTPRGHIR